MKLLSFAMVRVNFSMVFDWNGKTSIGTVGSLVGMVGKAFDVVGSAFRMVASAFRVVGSALNWNSQSAQDNISLETCLFRSAFRDHQPSFRSAQMSDSEYSGELLECSGEVLEHLR